MKYVKVLQWSDDYDSYVYDDGDDDNYGGSYVDDDNNGGVDGYDYCFWWLYYMFVRTVQAVEEKG